MLSPFATPTTNLFVPNPPVVVSVRPPTCCALTASVTAAPAVRLVASMSPAMAVRSSVAAPPVLFTVRPVAPILPPEAIVTDVVARSIVTPPLAVTAKRSVVVPSAVTTTLPAPATVFPVRIDAAAVRATPPFTVVATAEPFEASSSVPVKVTLWFTRTLLSASPLILLTFTAASAVPIVTARAPVPVLLMVSPATTLAAAVMV